MDITDLQLGLDYLFRVKAVNGEGESAALQTGDMITAKDPFRAPSAPTNIRSTEVGSRWVKLAWNKPSSDGGATINNYIIERKDPLTKTFIKVTETLTGQTEVTVSGLKEHSINQFRVRAANKSGMSDASQATSD